LSEEKELDGLRASLAIAVQNEEYEKAAEIRDRIRQLEGAK
jgi:protein-arginine kinase activator protein McsA